MDIDNEDAEGAKEKFSLVKNEFLNCQNNELVINAKKLITDTLYEGNNDFLEKNITHEIADVNNSDLFRTDSTTPWYNSWLFTALKVYSKFIFYEHKNQSIASNIQYIKYPVNDPHKNWGKNETVDEFLDSMDSILSILREDLILFQGITNPTDISLLEMNNVDDVTNLFKSMKLKEIGSHDNNMNVYVYITYYEFIIWYKNNIVLNDNSYK